MAAKLTFRYDKVGDILYIDKCLPYKEQDGGMIGAETAVRTNPTTGEVETIELLFFKKRLDEGECIELPVDAKIELTEEALL
jgi:hypothetical protein